MSGTLGEELSDALENELSGASREKQPDTLGEESSGASREEFSNAPREKPSDAPIAHMIAPLFYLILAVD